MKIEKILDGVKFGFLYLPFPIEKHGKFDKYKHKIYPL